MTELLDAINATRIDVRKAIVRAVDNPDALRRGDEVVAEQTVGCYNDVCVVGTEGANGDVYAANHFTGGVTACFDVNDEFPMLMAFDDYLGERIFTFGTYEIEAPYDAPEADARVAEYDDGSGYIVPEDLRRAIEDNGVAVQAVEDGWLHLSDSRNLTTHSES
jgi:hypothetical protein